MNDNLSELDLSNHVRLENLQCISTNISELDISKNTNLERLYCSDNNLSELDVSNNTQLSDFNCTSNSISLPLYKDEETIYIDFSDIVPDASRVSNPSNGDYDSASARIYLSEALRIGATLTYNYRTGYGEQQMTVKVSISEIIDLSEPTATPGPEPTSAESDADSGNTA